MNRIIDIRVEALANPAASMTEAAAVAGHASLSARGTFFLETFGCQIMSMTRESAGLLLARGISKWKPRKMPD